MKIDLTVINIPDIKGQNDLQTNGRPDVRGRTKEDTAPPGDRIIDPILNKKTIDEKQKQKNTNTSSNPILSNLKPIFALDDDKNVVIRFLDEKGKTVKQYPPEEYLDMMRKLNETVKSLYSKKV